jgi:hypothetical protein
LKKRVVLALVFALLLNIAMVSTASAATKTIVLTIGSSHMLVNNVSQKVDATSNAAPIVIKGRTLLPIRAIIEQMGGTLAWDQTQKLVTINLGTKTIKITINQSVAQIKDSSVSEAWSNCTLDVPAMIIQGRTFVPLRFVAENSGATVAYNGTLKTITLTFTPIVTESPKSNWSGTWDTDWGEMTLVQTGNTVTGEYTHDSGKISGTVSGNKLIGTWSESPSYNPPSDAGDVEFTLSANGNSFDGSWRYGSTGSMSGGWVGTRIK